MSFLSYCLIREDSGATYIGATVDMAHRLRHHNGEIKGIYEICNTHKTCSEDRPEPWVEINATNKFIL